MSDESCRCGCSTKPDTETPTEDGCTCGCGSTGKKDPKGAIA